MEVPRWHHREGGDGGGGTRGGGERDRMAQWSFEETRELLASRAELDRSFVQTKRNKHLWAAVSSRMEERGFRRTPDQCKCKWKNLITRYKGREATEGDADRQFPFYDDMKRIFSARKRKDGAAAAAGSSGGGGSSSKQVKIALMELMIWQSQAEAMRMGASEEREAERREKEMECRMAMESLAVEKAVVDQGWRQREEERWVREETRARRWDGLVSALLERLGRRGS
ncbi:unnamed protein product [Spirodela intermedia]|uniref:Myb-like domain-containing protein n=1 Tax=Spirodela intermedia TaxID=51605 RepID=A0A7I8IG88_SPIIN|nr:unnamed protein product [Spirodela intermedia]CAA6656888.1 unnamed protein product [Spirodela intermedia]